MEDGASKNNYEGMGGEGKKKKRLQADPRLAFQPFSESGFSQTRASVERLGTEPSRPHDCKESVRLSFLLRKKKTDALRRLGCVY